MKRIAFVFLFGLGAFNLFPQCEIKNRIFPDQTMYFYMDPVTFFKTEKDFLRGNVTTDKENYFLQFIPSPFPPKTEKIKFKNNAIIHLTNKQTYTLECYDYRYTKNDSSLVLSFLLPKKNIEEFENVDVDWLDLDLGDDRGKRHYIFILHKSALREQLICLEAEN